MKILIGAVFFNEEEKLTTFVPKFKDLKLGSPFKVVFYNDGSTDKSVSEVSLLIKKHHLKNCILLSNKVNRGVGFTIREIIHYGLKNKFDICVIMAGNGKDSPLEIPLLTKPLINEGYDYVQGSRFLKGGSFKNLPFFRKTLILGFTFLMSLFTLTWCTDASNGFRAYKLSIFKDPRIKIDQSWLDRYELETYLHYKVITLGYWIKEVAVSKDYLFGVKNYSKMKPIFDWWKFGRPIFLLKLGIKS